MAMRRVILTFHGVGDVPNAIEGSERDVWVDLALYESILDEVRGRDDVAITFDDGNRSDLEIALPALAERGLKATFFVLGDRIGAPGYLSEDDIRELAGAGMGVGCHGAAHLPWRSLGDEELRRDLHEGRGAVESVLGRSIDTASCPFGDYDRRVLAELRRLGFRRVYTSDGGWTSSGAWLQRRNTVTPKAWPSIRERLEGREPARARALRRLKGVVKRWR